MGLEKLDFNIEVSHHEVAPGQHEIDFRFADALKTADAVITFKQAIKAIVDNMATFDQLDYRVTFMPKPWASCIIWRPIEPVPIIPIVFPYKSIPIKDTNFISGCSDNIFLKSFIFVPHAGEKSTLPAT